ncbi:MAG: restriction endonuclease subunit S [Bacilli bacterium]
MNIVSKKDILESDDLSLVGDRYKKSIKASKKIKYFKIEEICDVVKEKTKEGVTPYIEIGDINIDKNDYADKDKPTVKGAIKVQKNDILISKVRPTRGAVALAKNDSNASNAFCIIRAKDINKINIKYIYFNIYKNSNFFEYLGANSKGATYPTCSDADILNYEIPVPPIEIQNQIVQEIEQYQKIIDGAKQVVENWKPVIEIAPEWEEVELGEILIRKKDKVDPRKKAKEEVIYIGLENIESNTGNLQGELTNKYSEIKSIKNVFENANILYGTLRPNLNKVICPKFSGICSTDILVLEPIKNNIKTDFYCYFMRQQVFNEQVIKGVSGAQLPRVSYDYIKNLKLPFPNIDEQILILNGIQEEEKIIVQNKKIIGIYEAKIKEKINKIWNE